MFLTQYKNKNENLFKKNTNETNNHLSESFYNLFENGQNSTKNKSFVNKEKIAHSVLAYKENSKKSISDLGDCKIKRGIKVNCFDYKRNYENKFIELYSSNNQIKYELRFFNFTFNLFNI